MDRRTADFIGGREGGGRRITEGGALCFRLVSDRFALVCDFKSEPAKKNGHSESGCRTVYQGGRNYAQLALPRMSMWDITALWTLKTSAGRERRQLAIQPLAPLLT